MDQQYHNECEKCGELFWTADAFNTECWLCKFHLSRLFDHEGEETWEDARKKIKKGEDRGSI